MSNYYDVALVIRDSEMYRKISEAVLEIPAADRLWREKELRTIYDIEGNKFLRVDWPHYNNWASFGGDELMDVVRKVASDDGYAFVSIDDFGEDEEVVGEDFEGLIYVDRCIGTSASCGPASKAMSIAS